MDSTASHPGSSSTSPMGSPPLAPTFLPPDFLDANIDDIVTLIADMLDRLTSHNDQIPLRPEALTRFHSRSPPAITIQEYLKRIVRYTNVEVGGIKLIELNVLEREFLEKMDWRLTCTREMLQEYYTNLVRTHSGIGVNYQIGASPATNVRPDPVGTPPYQDSEVKTTRSTPSPPRSSTPSSAPSSVRNPPTTNPPPSTRPFATPQTRDPAASPSRIIFTTVSSPSLRRAGRSPLSRPSSQSIPASPSLKRAREGVDEVAPSLTSAHMRKMEESSPRTRRRTEPA
ncbi:hypothetical protein FRC09_020767 [Ceratobasidium sp. 395]|nr:hypothetical protein FRC09_020767 [Ceratobasidium sp. 395]